MDEEDVQRLDSLKSRESRLLLQGNEGACQRLDNLRGGVSAPLTNPNEGACTYISERWLCRPSMVSTRDTPLSLLEISERALCSGMVQLNIGNLSYHTNFFRHQPEPLEANPTLSAAL